MKHEDCITERKPIIFWYALMSQYEEAVVGFNIIFNDEEERVTPREADNVMLNAMEMKLPTFCLN